MTYSIRSVRLNGYTSDRLNNISAERGEIFFDQTSGTLRFFDQRTGDGQLIATRAWVQSNPSGLPSQAGNSGKILTTNGSTISWVTPAVNYSLPTATTSVLGGVKVDGSTITIDGNGVISGANTYSLPTATNTVLGGVKVDSSTITISNQIISVANGVYTTGAYADPSWITSLAYSKLTGSPIIPTNNNQLTNGEGYITSASLSGYALSSAIPTNNNQLTNGAGYITTTGIPTQTGNTGKYLTTDGNTLSWEAVTAYSLPTASTTVLGGVKVDASSITIDGSGVISVPAVATIGVTNGLAQLGSDGKLVASQIPTSLSGAIVFKGTWNATTNTPTLADGVGTNGWEYAVSVGGTINLGSGNITFVAGDYIIYNGTIWQRIPSNTVAEAGTLTGTTLNPTVVTSSLTTVGVLDHLTVTNPITGSITGNAGTVTNGVVTTGSYANPTWITSLAASKVGLGNVTNESKATMFASPTFTGTVSGVTAAHVGLGNVTNESKATMFASPTFTGTVAGVTAAHVGLGNVTNESKATMFASPTFTGTVSGVTKAHVGLGSVENTALSTWTGSTSITTLGTVTVGSAPASDVYAWAKTAVKPTYTATEVGLGNVTNESKATMFTNPTFTGTVAGVTATHVGLGNVTNESKATMFTNPTFTGTVAGVTAAHVGLGNVTNESKATMFTNPTFTGTVTGLSVTASDVGLGNVTNESKATMFTNPTFTGTVAGVTATHVGLGNVTNETKATMFASPTFTGAVSGISAFMISSLKYAKTELLVTNVANSGYRLNYPDYSPNINPSIWVTAGDTLAFNLNGISGNHPFLIQVNNAGTWTNYDLGLVHVGPAPSGTVSTGTNAQGKSVGMLYWSLPPDIASGDYRYICSLHFNMTGTIRVSAVTDIRDVVYTAGATTGTITPNCALGNVQTITLTGSITLNAFATPVSGQSLTMIITQPATGGPYTLTSTMKFAGGAKTLSTAANAVDMLTISYVGTTYYASLVTGFA